MRTGRCTRRTLGGARTSLVRIPAWCRVQCGPGGPRTRTRRTLGGARTSPSAFRPGAGFNADREVRANRAHAERWEVRGRPRPHSGLVQGSMRTGRSAHPHTPNAGRCADVLVRIPAAWYPSTRRLDGILPEIKGAELRKHAIRGNARKKRRAIGFLDRIMSLLRQHGVRLVACIWIVCSGLLYPIACYAYCTGHVSNVHVQSGASHLRDRYGLQLKQLQHRYYERGRYVGGVTVADHLNQRSGALMFRG